MKLNFSFFGLSQEAKAQMVQGTIFQTKSLQAWNLTISQSYESTNLAPFAACLRQLNLKTANPS